MKRLKKIGTLIFMLVISITLVANFLLLLPPVRSHITVGLQSALTQLLGTKVSIGKIHNIVYGDFDIRDVVLFDKSGDSLLYAKKIVAGVDLLPLLSKRIEVTNSQLIGLSIKIKSDSVGGVSNLQFLLDRFAKKDTIKREFDYLVNLRSIIVRNGSVVYCVNDSLSNADRFSPHNIQLSKLNANIALGEYSRDTLSATIKRLSFMEQSGVEVKRMSVKVEGNNQQAIISNMGIELKRSKVQFDTIHIDYSRGISKKELVRLARAKITLLPSTVYPDDLAPFMPSASHFTSPLHLSFAIEGGIDSMDLKHFSARMVGDLDIDANVRLEHLSDVEKFSLNADIRSLSLSSQAIKQMFDIITKGKTPLPYPLRSLGNVSFKGGINGRANSSIVANGIIITDIGTLSSHFNIRHLASKNQFRCLGSISTGEIDVKTLFPLPNPYGLAEVKLGIDIVASSLKKIEGEITGDIERLDFMGYSYRDIELQARIGSNSYGLNLMVEDPNVEMTLAGEYKLVAGQPEVDLRGRIGRINPSRLHLLEKYPDATLSFGINSHLSLKDSYDPLGHFTIKNFLFVANKERIFYDSIKVASEWTKENFRKISVTSAPISAEISGDFSLRNLASALNRVAGSYIPSLLTAQKSPYAGNDYFELSLHVNETSKLSKVLQLPFELHRPLEMQGRFDCKDPVIDFKLFLPDISFGKTRLYATQLNLFNDSSAIRLSAHLSNKTNKGVDLNYRWESHIMNDSIFSSMHWSNTGNVTMSGELKSIASFYESEVSSKMTKVEILPSQFIINDSLWSASHAKIWLSKESIEVRDFEIGGDNQYLYIDGKASNDPDDRIALKLKEISLDYIFDIVKIDNISFGGKATGDFTMSGLFSDPIIESTNLSVDNLAFNNTLLGQADIESYWDNNKKAVFFNAMVDDSTHNRTTLYGSYAIPTDSLTLDIRAQSVDVKFLRPFLGHLLVDLEGKATGNILLYGPSKYLSIEGLVHTDSVSFGVDILNTRYTFSDTIHLEKFGIKINNIKAYDKYNNFATANGVVGYTYFKEPTFDFRIQTDKLFCYDRTDKLGLPILGTVFASGNVSIKGDEETVDITADVRSEAGSSMRYSIADNTRATDYQYITFIKPQDVYIAQDSAYLTPVEELPSQEVADQQTVVNMNLQMEINPNLNVEVIMDEITGDVIHTTGNGDVRVEYSTKTNEMKMFGGYNIAQGNYTFSLQNVITKNFSLLEGSSIQFNGRDFSSVTMDVKAMYLTTANLAELDQSFQQELNSRTTMPVQCLMNISGSMLRPTLTFDINVPSLSSELNRRMKNLISSEDMINRQIIYLLVLGKFYTPEYMSVSGRQNNEMAALASSAVSSQLNNLLGNMIDNWNFGTNFRSLKGDFSDLEVELALSGQLLNNRLLINGNFGYRDKTLNLSQTSFIGDIDVEYKLTPSGTFRLKAYSHTNDRPFYYKPALTTQGLGFIFKKDINAIRFPFRRKRNVSDYTDVIKHNIEP